MSSPIEVIAIVEGKTEQIFINSLLGPYLAQKMVIMRATQVSKPGQKGGDVRFERVAKDLGIHLKQRRDTYVTTLVDFYGVKEWPGKNSIPNNASPAKISEIVSQATLNAISQQFAAQQAERRFVPYMAIHEFEALLFSDSKSLAEELGIPEKEIKAVLKEYHEPEAINRSPKTAPSKHLDRWSHGKFPKTTTGITIAHKIGIPRMRQQCPLFDAWLKRFEAIAGGQE